MYIFKGVQNLAYFFTLNISTIFSPPKGDLGALARDNLARGVATGGIWVFIPPKENQPK